jgi:hypothetical protein
MHPFQRPSPASCQIQVNLSPYLATATLAHTTLSPYSTPFSSSSFYGTLLPLYLQEKPLLDEVGVQASILELLSSLVSDIKVAIVAGRDVTSTVQEVRDIVEGVKNASFDEHDLKGTSPAQRVQIMKNKRRLVIEVLAV